VPRDAALPPTIAELELWWTDTVTYWRNRFYLQFEVQAPVDNPSAQLVLQAVEQDVAPILHGLMGRGIALSACRLLSSGIPFLRETAPAYLPNGPPAPVGSCLTLHWQTFDPLNDRRFLTHISGYDMGWISDASVLPPESISAIDKAAAFFLRGMNDLPDALGGHATFVVVRRRTKDGPLPAAISTPVRSGSCSFTLSTIGRRGPHARRVPPVSFLPGGH